MHITNSFMLMIYLIEGANKEIYQSYYIDKT